MKKFLLTLVLMVGVVLGLFAQNLTYQAVIRDNNQQLVVNKAVKATVTITFTSGDPYQAEFNGSTNLHGLLSIEFGDGSLVGRDWTCATIAVKVVNSATPSIVYVNDEPRPVSAVPYALSVDGMAIQQYLTEHKYVTEMQVGNQIHDSISNIAAKAHTHDNKALLDTYTQTEANLAEAVSKKHSHDNMTVLNATTAPYTDADSAKLDGIAAGAEVNVQSDWKQTDGSKDDYIKNKPSITDTVNNILTMGKYVTETTLDGRHYLTSDSAVITAMQGNIATNKADITTNTADIAALAGRMNTFNTNVCDSVKNCDFSGNTSIQNMLQQLEARLTGKIDSLAHVVDSLAALIPGGDTTAFTCGTDSVKDVDNNWYNTVKIGNQCWMAQNMRCTTSPNGLLQKGETGSSSSSSPLYYDYPDATLSLRERGLLYNWCGAMDTTANISYTYRRGICPEGWHVPSDAEWTQLTTYVKSVSEYVCDGCSGTDSEWYTSCIAKALSQPTGWSNTGTGCNAGNTGDKANLTGFSAVPAGGYAFGGFSNFGINAFFWSATQNDDNVNTVWYRYLVRDDSNVNRLSNTKNRGFSVRCLKD